MFLTCKFEINREVLESTVVFRMAFVDTKVLDVICNELDFSSGRSIGYELVSKSHSDPWIWIATKLALHPRWITVAYVRVHFTGRGNRVDKRQS